MNTWNDTSVLPAPKDRPIFININYRDDGDSFIDLDRRISKKVQWNKDRFESMDKRYFFPHFREWREIFE